MAIRSDSYSSTGEVKAFCYHLLDGQTNFNSTTRPKLTEVEKFIDRASSHINLAAVGAGFSASSLRSNSTAKLACDDWVTQRTVEYVEQTQRNTGFGGEEGQRAFSNLAKRATDFINLNRVGFVRLGVSVSHGKAEGLQFTAMGAVEDRVDPSDTSLAQPMFSRSQFDAGEED